MPRPRTRTGFRPPDTAARQRALGETTLFSVEGFDPVHDPEPGDWLAEHHEPGQTFAEYVASDPPRPGMRRTIVLAPLGDLPRAPDLAVLRRYAAAYFQLPVRAMDALPLERAAPTRRTREGHVQLYAPDILSHLRTARPADAFAVMALTEFDLYPDPEWNFVFGMASLTEGVGVHSFVRYFTPEADATLVLRRSLKVMVHEVGHMFGLAHCIWFDCVMNGSNHLAEADRRPMRLCPVCLRKLHHAVGFDPKKREADLLALHRELGI